MLSIGLIGFGRWGPNLARNAIAAGCRLAAIADPQPERLALAQERYPEARSLASWQDLLRQTDVEAVAIATPAGTHGEIAEAALRSGRHVLVEKPMTTRAEEAGRLVELAAAAGLCLMVDHTFLYTPSIQAMRQLLTDGRLGAPRRYEGLRQGPRPVTCDVDVLWDLAAHDLAIMDHLFDRPARRVSANLGDSADDAGLTVEFDDGIEGELRVGWGSPIKVRRAALSGSRGRVSYDGAVEGELRLDGEVRALVNGKETLTAVLHDFAAAISGRRPPLADGAAGFRVVRLLEAAAASLRQGRPVEL